MDIMKKIKKAMLPVVVFAKIDTRRLFRDKIAIFFTFLFPLIFLFIFGGIFGRDGDISFDVALLNKSDSQFSRAFSDELKDKGLIEVSGDIADRQQADEAMRQSRIDAIIIMPEQFGEMSKGYPSGQLEVVYSKSNEQSGQTLASILQAEFQEINESVLGSKEEPLAVTTSAAGDDGLSSFDYLFPGLVGFAVLGMGLFGPTSVFPRMKQRGVLRRYHTTSLRVWQFVAGNVISNAFAALLSVGFMIIVALTLPMFDINFQGNIIELAIFIVLGAVTIFGIGLAIGGWAKNENQAAPLSNLISFPMMFLSGTFFPRFIMPDWLQSVSAFIPLTPFIDGVRMIMVEGYHLIDIMPQIGMLIVWSVIIYSIAFRFFRWE